jgi:hypothetical protein
MIAEPRKPIPLRNFKSARCVGAKIGNRRREPADFAAKSANLEYQSPLIADDGTSGISLDVA